MTPFRWSEYRITVYSAKHESGFRAFSIQVPTVFLQDKNILPQNFRGIASKIVVNVVASFPKPATQTRTQSRPARIRRCRARRWQVGPAAATTAIAANFRRRRPWRFKRDAIRQFCWSRRAIWNEIACICDFRSCCRGRQLVVQVLFVLGVLALLHLLLCKTCCLIACKQNSKF